MLTPSGSAWMTSTWAPVAARMSGPTTEPEPLAASSTSRSPLASIDAARREPVAPVVGRAGALASTIRPSSAFGDAGQLLGPPDELLELVLDRVVELEAVAVEDLEPVVVRRGCARPRP